MGPVGVGLVGGWRWVELGWCGVWGCLGGWVVGWVGTGQIKKHAQNMEPGDPGRVSAGRVVGTETAGGCIVLGSISSSSSSSSSVVGLY